MSPSERPGAATPRLTLPHGDPVAVELTLAIHDGDLDALRRLLADRPELWHAAALGTLAHLEELLGATPSPTREDVNQAFWQACHGGQRRTAERLLAAGADIDATPGYANDQTALDVATRPDTRRELLASWLREHGARAPTKSKWGSRDPQPG